MYRSASITRLSHWLQTSGRRPLAPTVIVVLVGLGGLVGALGQRGLPPWPPWTPDPAQAAVAVFGPEDFLRSKGKPVTIVRPFSVADPNGDFTLCIDNGGQAGTYGLVDSAVVTLNGLTVASPSDFNETVLSVIRPVSVTEDNVLEVELRGATPAVALPYRSWSGRVARAMPSRWRTQDPIRPSLWAIRCSSMAVGRAIPKAQP